MEKNHFRDRIEATLLLVAIGDALGFPMETATGEEIAADRGRVEDYTEVMPGHWNRGDGLPLGQWTDDWYHTAMCMKSITNQILLHGRRGMSPDLINLQDIAARLTTDACMAVPGMGGSTRKAFERIRAGVLPIHSGTAEARGNGVAMKMAPFGIMLAVVHAKIYAKYPPEEADREFLAFRRQFNAKLLDIAFMTHWNDLGAASGLAQAYAVFACLALPEEGFTYRFLATVYWACLVGEGAGAPAIDDLLSTRYRQFMDDDRFLSMDVEELNEECGGGVAHAYHSVPFSHLLFLRNPGSIETLFDAANAGGDTDSNASMVGALLGARNGKSVLAGHEHLIDGLHKSGWVRATIRRFVSALVR